MVKKMHTVEWEPTYRIAVKVELALLRALGETANTWKWLSPTWEIIDILSNGETSKKIFNGCPIFSFLNICPLTLMNQSNLIRINKRFALSMKLILLE